jgi:hypothetical protein
MGGRTGLKNDRPPLIAVAECGRLEVTAGTGCDDPRFGNHTTL